MKKKEKEKVEKGYYIMHDIMHDAINLINNEFKIIG